jgi:pteridine reductase
MTAIALAGKRALVTGAGKRVGRAIAIALAREGMQLAVHYRSSAREARETCRLVEAEGGSAFELRADLDDRDATRALVDEAAARLGGLDLVVPNAAGYERLSFSDIDDAAWDRMLGLNLTSPFLLAQRAVPFLRASRGSLIFITCASVSLPYKNHLPYVVSKGGLHHLMRVLSLELAPEVRVNAVAPGTVFPPEGMSAADIDKLRGRIPLAHLGSPEDVAEAVVYLARAPFVTGHEIQIDGGRTVAGRERPG